MPKILIVEDDPMIRDVLSRSLLQQSYQVLVATDGVEGVQLARVNRPDLIVMDMGLPKLNGWQATHRIRSMPVTRSIPIIALTAYAMKEDRIRCFQMGCDEYETKPVELDRLMHKIRGLLQASIFKADGLPAA